MNRHLPAIGLLATLGLAPAAASAQQPPPSGPALTLSAGGETNCHGRDVTIAGDGQSYDLLGGCRSVVVNGTNNIIHVELQPGAGLRPGAGNKITWFLGRDGQPPVVADAGPGSQVLQEQRLGSSVLPSSATPAPDDALTLNGGQPVNEADCGGRDAVINADDSRFVLRGRCRSISVTGSHDVVEAEMVGGSRIRINGDHSVVQFALVGTGADPIVSAVGQGSSAWRIQRLGATSRATASQGVTPSADGMVVRGGKGVDADQMRAVPEAPQ